MREKQLAIIFLLLMVITIYILLMSYRQKNISNKLLVEKNKQIEKQNKQLVSMNEQISSINHDLKQSQDELLLSNNSKDRFFSILAHDLRSPLHNVTGLSFLLDKHYDSLTDSEKKSYSESIHDSCINLKRLLENLLEWSKTQTNEMILNPVFIDLRQIIENIILEYAHLALEKSISIQNQIKTPLVITADAHMIETLFRNLLSNGLKYTNRGGAIKIFSVKQDGFVTVGVEDNGVGIREEEIEQIFRIDSDIKNSGTDNEKGSGLGLVLCKEFACLHNGDIRVESQLGKGSVFYVDLPINLDSYVKNMNKEL